MSSQVTLPTRIKTIRGVASISAVSGGMGIKFVDGRTALVQVCTSSAFRVMKKFTLSVPIVADASVAAKVMPGLTPLEVIEYLTSMAAESAGPLLESAS